MRFVPISRWLAVLAFALQALMALQGEASEHALNGRLGERAFCELGPRALVGSAPVGEHGRDAAACLSCPICLGGFSPVATLASEIHLVGPCDGARAELVHQSASAALWALARAHRARAPPILA